MKDSWALDAILSALAPRELETDQKYENEAHKEFWQNVRAMPDDYSTTYDIGDRLIEILAETVLADKSNPDLYRQMYSKMHTVVYSAYRDDIAEAAEQKQNDEIERLKEMRAEARYED